MLWESAISDARGAQAVRKGKAGWLLFQEVLRPCLVQFAAAKRNNRPWPNWSSTSARRLLA